MLKVKNIIEKQELQISILTCKAMTDCRKAEMLAAAFTQTGPLTLLSKYVGVEAP